jgi:hypothetical protein
MKKPNNFNIFQNDLRTDIVMGDVGCEEYSQRVAEIYGSPLLVRSFFIVVFIALL